MTYYWNRLVALADFDSQFTAVASMNKFQRIRASLGTTDIVPLGGAFAKRCTEMWDGLGAADAWTYAGDDLNSNGIPDWWEKVAKESYGAADGFTWDTLVNYNGQWMTAREAYIRDLAAGMQPNGTVDDAFKALVDRELSCFYSRDVVITDIIYAFMASHGIEPTEKNWETIRQMFKRLRDKSIRSRVKIC